MRTQDSIGVAELAECSVKRPEPQELWDSIANKFSATVLGGSDIIPESNEWYVTSLLYAMSEEYYAYGDQLRKESNPETACCDNLLKMGREWGMYPKPATYAEGYVVITGDPDASLVDPLLMTSGGKKYRSTGAVPSRLNSQGAAVVRFRAIDPGPSEDLNTTGQLTNAPEGVNSEVEISGGRFCGGMVEEKCEQFRQRLISRLAYKPKATQSWLKEKILEWPCVTRVCDRSGSCCDPDDTYNDCCPDGCAENLGNNFYVFMDDTFDCGIAPQCVLDEIQDWIFGASPMQGRGLGQAPINVCGKLISPTPSPFILHVNVGKCLSVNEEQKITEAIYGFMLQVCPSTDILSQQIVVVAGQILGPLTSVDVWFEVADGTEGITSTKCGLEVECDYMPCLDEIVIFSPQPEVSDCGDS